MKKLLAILLVLCFATPALAQNWHFYGSLRTHVGFYDIDEDFGGGPAMDGALVPDESGVLLGLSGQSRFGARGQATENLWGIVEFGLRDTNAAATPSKVEQVYTRLAYGNWNFGAGNLIVGKDYTPGTFLGYSGMIGDIGDQGDANMLVAGLPYIGRQPQIKLRMGDFDIALIERNQGVTGEDHIPRIEASYVFRAPMVNVRGVAGFQTYDDGAGNDIDSFLVGLGASFDLDPAYVKATVSYLQNAGNYGSGSIIAPMARSAVGDEDAESYQGTLVAGYKISPTMTGEVGFGYAMNEVGDQEMDGWVAYAQLPISLDRGMSITPEFGYVSRGDWEDAPVGPGGVPVDLELGNMMYFTANFRVDF